MVTARQKNKASVRALSSLLELLASDQYSEGSRLPPERDLAIELGVSRRSLREALEQLEAENKIWRGVGQGTFVGGRPLDSSTDFFGIKRLTSPPELMEARIAMEPSIAALASLHATTDDIEEIQRCVKKSAGVKGANAWELWDGSLHKAIANATHNTLLVTLFEALNSVRTHADWGRLRQASLTHERQQLYTNQHHSIVAAISRRSAEDSARAMKEHLLTVKSTMLSDWENLTPDIPQII